MSLRRQSPRRAAISLLALAAVLPAAMASAEVVVRGEEGFPHHEARPAPAAIFPDEHISGLT